MVATFDIDAPVIVRESVIGLSPEEIRGMDPTRLLEMLEPFVNKYASRSYIPGLDFADKAQEIRMTVLRCQKAYDPDAEVARGKRRSSFMNFLITAVSNRLGNLDFAAERQHYVVTELRCLGCERLVSVHSDEKRCASCGGGRWGNVRNGRTRSTDALSELGDFWEPAGPDDGLAEVLDVIRRIVSHVESSARREVEVHLMAALGFGKPGTKVDPAVPVVVRRRIVQVIKEHPGILNGIPYGARVQRTQVRVRGGEMGGCQTAEDIGAA